MRYIIHCQLKGDVEEYHHKLRDEFAEKFGLDYTKKEDFPTHFTLKYSIEVDDITPVEQVCEEFAKKEKKAPMRAGSWGRFPPHVVFIHIEPSSSATMMFERLLKDLKKVEGLQWSAFDGEDMHFHITVAERCNEKFDEAWAYLQTKPKEYFDIMFDNITILKLTSETPHPGIWELHKQWKLQD